jgi:hypothetical protein
MSGERDLDAILSRLPFARLEGTYVYASATSLDSCPDAVATIHEDEGTTFIIERTAAERLGLTWSFAAAWLTVEVRTSLEAVGLTAKLTAALAEAGIPCNVLAGAHHDHFLVPIERADDALAALESLRRRASRAD